MALAVQTAQACEFGTSDLARARDLYIEAARGGHAGAQRRLGRAYEYGEFRLVIDLEAALTWFQKAAKGGKHYA